MVSDDVILPWYQTILATVLASAPDESLAGL
jgi:hypothetical protein